MVSELKNCPFCGREVMMKGYADSKGSFYYVDCECGGNMMGAETKEEAAAKWNRRSLAAAASVIIDTFGEDTSVATSIGTSGGKLIVGDWHNTSAELKRIKEWAEGEENG